MYKLYIDLLLIVWKKSSADFREIFLPLIANETSRSSYRSISLDSQHLCVCVCVCVLSGTPLSWIISFFP